ncbi:MAG: diguanylate cyclase [Bdellovibrionales bacterium]
MSAALENNKRKVLVVDDDPAALRISAKALEFEGYQVETASSGQEAVAKMNTWRPHLVLLDVSMPGLDGLETLKILRARDEYVSVLFLSGKSASEDVIRGLDSGADDYIRKPFDMLEMLARVRSQLRIKDLNDSLKKANDKLKELVDIDDLTGLFNMRSLYKRLDFELDRARRYRRSVCVMMMDMDFFKRVNDQHDHLFGSFVLSEVGKMIRENIRKVDFAARYGGDEYLIVLTEIDKTGAQTFADRLRARIEAHTFSADNHTIRLTASLGFAIVSPTIHNIDARTFVRLADQALYKAKETGRNRVVSFTDQDLPLATPEEVFRRGK